MSYRLKCYKKNAKKKPSDSAVQFVSGEVYIHNWPLQSFNQDYVLSSHITHVMCVNFICECPGLNFMHTGFTSNKSTHYPLDYGDFNLGYDSFITFRGHLYFELRSF